MSETMTTDTKLQELMDLHDRAAFETHASMACSGSDADVEAAIRLRWADGF